MTKRLREDVTETRAIEDQRQDARRLQAIGRLAGGVAHDFNNLLTTINGFAQIVLEALPDDDARVDDVKEILGAGQRAAELTNQLLAFSQRQILQPQIVDLGSFVSRCAPRLRALVGGRSTSGWSRIGARTGRRSTPHSSSGCSPTWRPTPGRRCPSPGA